MVLWLFILWKQCKYCIIVSTLQFAALMLYLPESFWNVWSLASSLSNNTTLCFQWVPGHAGLSGNENADLLAKVGASLPTDAIPCPLPTFVAKVRYFQYHNWRRHISHSYMNFQVPEVSSEELLPFCPIRWELSRLRCHGPVFFYLHIFTGSVGSRILLVVPVDTLYRTSTISSSTVLPLNPFVNLSLAPLSLFLIYDPDLRVWLDCWVSAEFLCAPIPQNVSGSTTTTTLTGFTCFLFLLLFEIDNLPGPKFCFLTSSQKLVVGISFLFRLNLISIFSFSAYNNYFYYGKCSSAAWL